MLSRGKNRARCHSSPAPPRRFRRRQTRQSPSRRPASACARVDLAQGLQYEPSLPKTPLHLSCQIPGTKSRNPDGLSMDVRVIQRPRNRHVRLKHPPQQRQDLTLRPGIGHDRSDTPIGPVLATALEDRIVQDGHSAPPKRYVMLHATKLIAAISHFKGQLALLQYSHLSHFLPAIISWLFSTPSFQEPAQSLDRGLRPHRTMPPSLERIESHSPLA